MKGILTLGKFLIWLVVYLFFFSSFLVLIQYGTKNYASKMTQGWGSIAKEFEKSYRSLSNTQSAPASGTKTPTPEGGTATGTPAQAGELPGYVSLLIWGGVVISLLSFFWMVAIAFQESMLWGLAVLFVPFVAIIFWITHFREATPPFIIGAIGGFVLFFTFNHYGVDPSEYFMGTPSTTPLKAPNALEVEGMILPPIFLLSR